MHDSSSLAWQLTSRQLMVIDCTVTAVYGVLIGISTATDSSNANWTWVLVVGMALGGAVRRIWPRLALALVSAISLVAVALDVLRDPLLATSYCLYVVALTTGREDGPTTTRRMVGTAGLAGAALLVLTALGTPASTNVWTTNLGLTATGVAGLFMTWMLGVVVRDRRLAAAQAVRQLAQRAVTDERLRIARELHDIVAHSMGLIAVKAGVANHVVKVRPEEVSDALAVIEATSREALVELRYMLGLLRPDTGADTRTPPGGLAGLPELAGRLRSLGIDVDLQVDGTHQLSDGLGLAIYRIVQECLTNITKHSGATRCRVLVEVSGHDVVIQVTDNGSKAPTSTDGHGLIGIRERVGLYGGTLAAGPRPAGGFEVTAKLPYQTGGTA